MDFEEFQTQAPESFLPAKGCQSEKKKKLHRGFHQPAPRTTYRDILAIARSLRRTKYRPNHVSSRVGTLSPWIYLPVACRHAVLGTEKAVEFPSNSFAHTYTDPSNGCTHAARITRIPSAKTPRCLTSHSQSLLFSRVFALFTHRGSVDGLGLMARHQSPKTCHALDKPWRAQLCSLMSCLDGHVAHQLLPMSPSQRGTIPRVQLTYIVRTLSQTRIRTLPSRDASFTISWPVFGTMWRRASQGLRPRNPLMTASDRRVIW